MSEWKRRRLAAVPAFACTLSTTAVARTPGASLMPADKGASDAPSRDVSMTVPIDCQLGGES